MPSEGRDTLLLRRHSEAARAEAQDECKAFAIVIGITKYKYEEEEGAGGLGTFEDLPGAEVDATRLSATFTSIGIRTKVLPSTWNANEIKEGIKEAIKDLKVECTLLLAYSGHALSSNDGQTWVVPSQARHYADCIPLMAFVQQCVEEKALKYVHVCCFYFSCRVADEELPHEPVLARDETNKYINVYMCPAGHGLTDWCHGAQSLCYLLQIGTFELPDLLKKFEEDSRFLSLGSVQVEVDQQPGERIQLFTPPPPQTLPSYEAIMSKRQLDHIQSAPLFRYLLNSLSDRALENVIGLADQRHMRGLLGQIALKVACLRESQRFECIVSEVPFLQAETLQDVDTLLDDMQAENGTDSAIKGNNLPLNLLKALKDEMQDLPRQRQQACFPNLVEILEALNDYYCELKLPKESSQVHVEAMKVSNVAISANPERNLLECIGRLSYDTPLQEFFQDPQFMSFLVYGSLWIVVVKPVPFLEDERSRIRKGVCKVVEVLRSQVSIFAGATEPKHIPHSAMPASVLNLVLLARQAVPKDKMPRWVPLQAGELIKLAKNGRDEESHMRLMEGGIEKRGLSWLKGTANLRLIAERNADELKWHSPGLCEELERTLREGMPNDWSEDEWEIVRAVRFLLHWLDCQGRSEEMIDLLRKTSWSSSKASLRRALKEILLFYCKPRPLLRGGAWLKELPEDLCSTLVDDLEELESLGAGDPPDSDIESFAALVFRAQLQDWLRACRECRDSLRTRLLNRKCLRSLEADAGWVLAVLALASVCARCPALHDACFEEVFWQRCCLHATTRNCTVKLMKGLHLACNDDPAHLLRKMQARLPAGSALADYCQVSGAHAAENAAESDLYVFVVSCGVKEIVRLESSNEVLCRLNPVVERQKRRVFGRRLQKELGEPLRRLILDPVLAQTNCTHLLVSPDDMLFPLHFGSLPWPLDDTAVACHLSVTYLFGAIDLLQTGPTSRSPNSPVIVAAADVPDFVELPGVETEAEKVSMWLNQQFGAVKLYKGKDASIQALQQVNVPSILHISSASYSGGLVLCDSASRCSGHITSSEELLALNLDGTELVVLSTCEVTRATAEAFYLAGARSVAFCLTKISDNSASVFVEHFYRSLFDSQKPLSRGISLQQAEIQVKQAESLLQVAGHWVLYGAFDEMQVSSSSVESLQVQDRTHT